MQIGHLGRVCQRRIAHPQPDKAMPLDQRVGHYAGRWIDSVLRRHVYTAAGIIELKAVIAADDIVTMQFTHRERQQAMPTGVGQRNG